MKEWKVALIILLSLAVVGNIGQCGVQYIQREAQEVMSDY